MEESKVAETRLCESCKQQIEASKFSIHSLRCAKQQVIAKREKEAEQQLWAEKRALKEA